MINKTKLILDSEKYKEALKANIEQLKNIPDCKAFKSSIPNETVKNAIKDFEGSIKLIDMAIEKIRTM